MQPKGNAKFVEFVTLADKAQMPALRSSVLDWPYVEGLRLDEAMHLLTLLTFGAFGEVLAPQNGAPLRITIPWKYGFKGGKSIVKIRFVEKEPRTAWVGRQAPASMVYPTSTQPSITRAGVRQPSGASVIQQAQTLMFNGYADRVASLYTGMDLKKFY